MRDQTGADLICEVDHFHAANVAPKCYPVKHQSAARWRETLYMRDLRQTVSDNLRHLMDAKGWKQPDLARRSGVAQTSISKILRCAGAANIDTLSKLANAFSVETCALLIDYPDWSAISDLAEMRELFKRLPPDARQFVTLITRRELDLIEAKNGRPN